jgi:hypothetical protein
VKLNTANDQIKAIFAKAAPAAATTRWPPYSGITACHGCSRRPGKVTALSARQGPSRTLPVIRERPDPCPPAQRRQNGRI